MIALILVSEIVLLLVLCGALGILSAAEVAVPRVARGRARRLLETDRRGAAELDTLSDREGRLVGGAALVRALAYALCSVSVAWVLLALAPLPHEWMTLLVGGIIGMVIVFVFGEALPRTLAVHNPERVALASAPIALALVSASYPIASALAAVWTSIVGLVAEEPVGDAWVTAGEVRSGSGTDDEDAARDEAEDAIIDAVADFTSKIVREVMVPRTDMVCLEDTATVSEALDAIEQSGVSRLPVYHDTVDDILGVLYAKDLLLCLGRGTCEVPLGSIAREPFFVPETKPVEELLIEMRTKTHIAIVADEYGGTAGLVTIEDLLEEIVGEIFDEYDVEETLMIDLGDGRYRVDGRTPIDDLNAVFGTDVELEADSVGGLFVELSGRIPEAGETLEVEGLLITVEDVEGNRIRRVLVEPASTPQKGAEDE
ncbi:MAG: hemolysin family protein [Actinomycetota bacterium]|nr:hemolysin family protein [Actinomycetota bacterium]